MNNKARSDFLSDFFGPLSGEKIYVSALANDSTLKGRFPPKQLASTDPVEIDTFIANHDVIGRGVFFMISPVKPDVGAVKNKDAVSSLVCLHADIDFKSVVGNRTSVLTDLKKLWHEPTYTVLSGHGVHIYYLFSMPIIASPESVVRVENAARALADVVGGDRQVAEVSRVMRMPGTNNSKNPDDVVPCELIASSGKRYALSDLVTWLGTQEPVIERVAKAEPVDKPSDPKVINFFSQFGAEHARSERLDLEALLETMYYPGNVHNTEVQILSSLISRGENIDTAIDWVIQGLLDHIPEAVSWDMQRERAELQKSAITWFVKHPELIEDQINPPSWLLSNRAIKTKVLPNVKLAPSDGAQGPKPAPQSGSTSRVVDFTPSHTNGTARKMDEPSEGEKEQSENEVDKESDPAPEKAKADGATIHEFKKPGDGRVHLKTVPKAEPVPELRLKWGEELQKDPVVEPEWIVRDFVAARALNGFFGDGGVGKDFILMQLCIAMATGKPWFGMNVEPGRALYINVEDNWEMMRYRQDAIQRYYGVDFNDHPERFIMSSMVGQSTVLATFDSRAGIVKPTGLYDNFRKVIGTIKPKLIVVGNRVNIFGVNQNEDAQARQCLELLNALILEFNTTIIMPGHVSNFGMTTSTGTSGSVQWSNGTRHRVWMSMDADAGKEAELDEQEKRVRVLEVKKTNYSKIGTKIKIAWDDRSDNKGSYGLFVPIEEAKDFEVVTLPASEKNKQAEAEFLRMLDLFVGTNTAVNDSNKRSPSYAPRIMAEDTRCKYHKRHTKKQNYEELENAMRRLKDNGVIDSVRYGPPSADTYKLIRK